MIKNSTVLHNGNPIFEKDEPSKDSSEIEFVLEGITRIELL